MKRDRENDFELDQRPTQRRPFFQTTATTTTTTSTATNYGAVVPLLTLAPAPAPAPVQTSARLPPCPGGYPIPGSNGGNNNANANADNRNTNTGASYYYANRPATMMTMTNYGSPRELAEIHRGPPAPPVAPLYNAPSRQPVENAIPRSLPSFLQFVPVTGTNRNGREASSFASFLSRELQDEEYEKATRRLELPKTAFLNDANRGAPNKTTYSAVQRNASIRPRIFNFPGTDPLVHPPRVSDPPIASSSSSYVAQNPDPNSKSKPKSTPKRTPKLETKTQTQTQTQESALETESTERTVATHHRALAAQRIEIPEYDGRARSTKTTSDSNGTVESNAIVEYVATTKTISTPTSVTSVTRVTTEQTSIAPRTDLGDASYACEARCIVDLERITFEPPSDDIPGASNDDPEPTIDRESQDLPVDAVVVVSTPEEQHEPLSEEQQEEGEEGAMEAIVQEDERMEEEEGEGKEEEEESDESDSTPGESLDALISAGSSTARLYEAMLRAQRLREDASSVRNLVCDSSVATPSEDKSETVTMRAQSSTSVPPSSAVSMSIQTATFDPNVIALIKNMTIAVTGARPGDVISGVTAQAKNASFLLVSGIVRPLKRDLDSIRLNPTKWREFLTKLDSIETFSTMTTEERSSWMGENESSFASDIAQETDPECFFRLLEAGDGKLCTLSEKDVSKLSSSDVGFSAIEIRDALENVGASDDFDLNDDCEENDYTKDKLADDDNDKSDDDDDDTDAKSSRRYELGKKNKKKGGGGGGGGRGAKKTTLFRKSNWKIATTHKELEHHLGRCVDVERGEYFESDFERNVADVEGVFYVFEDLVGSYVVSGKGRNAKWIPKPDDKATLGFYVRKSRSKRITEKDVFDIVRSTCPEEREETVSAVDAELSGFPVEALESLVQKLVRYAPLSVDFRNRYCPELSRRVRQRKAPNGATSTTTTTKGEVLEREKASRLFSRSSSSSESTGSEERERVARADGRSSVSSRSNSSYSFRSSSSSSSSSSRNDDGEGIEDEEEDALKDMGDSDSELEAGSEGSFEDDDIRASDSSADSTRHEEEEEEEHDDDMEGEPGASGWDSTSAVGSEGENESQISTDERAVGSMEGYLSEEADSDGMPLNSPLSSVSMKSHGSFESDDEEEEEEEGEPGYDVSFEGSSENDDDDGDESEAHDIDDVFRTSESCSTNDSSVVVSCDSEDDDDLGRRKGKYGNKGTQRSDDSERSSEANDSLEYEPEVRIRPLEPAANPEEVERWDEIEGVYDAELVLCVAMARLLLSDGRFSRETKKFVNGPEALAKRLAMAVVHDACSGTEKESKMLLTACSVSFLCNKVRTWFPDAAVVKALFDMGLHLSKQRDAIFPAPDRSQTASNNEPKPYGLSDVVVSGLTLCSVLLDETNVVASDGLDARAVVSKWKNFSKPDLHSNRDKERVDGGNDDRALDGDSEDAARRFARPEVVPACHCVDQRWAPDVVYFFSYDTVRTRSSGGSKPFQGLARTIRERVADANPRRTPVFSWKRFEADEFVRECREAQKYFLMATVNSKRPRKLQREDEIDDDDDDDFEDAIDAKKTYELNYALDKSWIAGMLGAFETKTTPTKALVTLDPDDLSRIVAVKKPTADMQSAILTEDEEEAAKEEFLAALRDAVVGGLKLNKAKAPTKGLENCTLFDAGRSANRRHRRPSVPSSSSSPSLIEKKNGHGAASKRSRSLNVDVDDRDVGGNRSNDHGEEEEGAFEEEEEEGDDEEGDVANYRVINKTTGKRRHWKKVLNGIIELPYLKRDDSIKGVADLWLFRKGDGLYRDSWDRFERYLIAQGNKGNVSVIVRTLSHVAGFKSVVSLPKLNKDGGGCKNSAVAEDVGAFQMLMAISAIFPAALSRRKKTSTCSFAVTCPPLLWQIKDLMSDYVRGAKRHDPKPWGNVGDRAGRTPHAHQKEALDEMIGAHEACRKGHFIWIPVGMGKTMIVLEYLAHLKEEGSLPKYVIYSLPSEAQSSIVKEIEMFSFVPNLVLPVSKTSYSKNPMLKYCWYPGKTKLKPYAINLIEHDHLRKCGESLAEVATNSIVIVDEVHKTLNDTKRTSVALGLADTSEEFVALTGTPLVDSNVRKLAGWLEKIVPFEVNRRNFWVAVNGMISKRVNTGVIVKRTELVVDIPEDKVERYRSLLPPNLGGTNAGRSSPSQFAEATAICYDACTDAMVDVIVHKLAEADRAFERALRKRSRGKGTSDGGGKETKRAGGVFVIAKDVKHQETIRDRLIARGIKESDVFCILGQTSIHLTDASVESGEKDYRVVISRPQKSTGYTLSRLKTMLTCVYPSNAAAREQLEGRINRIGQSSKTVEIVLVYAGILETIHRRHETAKNLISVLETLANEIQ